jgi:hypothetical protein
MIAGDVRQLARRVAQASSDTRLLTCTVMRALYGRPTTRGDILTTLPSDGGAHPANHRAESHSEHSCRGPSADVASDVRVVPLHSR